MSLDKNNSRKYLKIVFDTIQKTKNENIEYNKFEKINLNNNINQPDYKDTNILNFLSFLNNTSCIPENLRIVCHSHIMKYFLKNNLKIQINNDLKDLFDENLWSIFLKSNNNRNISISRHGFSYANLIKEKSKSFFNKIRQVTESDAKLSVYGILTALLHGTDLVKKEKINKMNDPDIIFVSVLIRTWMTAICLYLPHNTNNEFTLVVSPYIKEEGMTLDNQPDSIDLQISFIRDFLNYLIEISEIKFTKEIINNNLTNIKNYFENNNKLLIYYKNVKIYFTLDKLNNSINYEKINNNNSYFNNTCSYFNKIFDIENIKIFHGENKPLRKDIELKFTRWCEPFSKKNKITNSKKLCKKRLNKHNDYNDNDDNNDIIHRKALYKNLNLTNSNSNSNNN